MAPFTTGSSTLLLSDRQKEARKWYRMSTRKAVTVSHPGAWVAAQDLYRQAGKDLVAELEALKQIDESRRIVRERLDAEG
jgi:hypothetical protein